ncbi:sortase A [Butyrivibrio sp. Su6]|uniref:sortase n=1 Tax=Butyrivibrio sp. Su6 TaxID=1520810 RepID=UPI00089F408C|nr:class D sortase [Butyrivibrio sp. Su6]SEF48457.1 sortase A [Butyrivibrio sp. Su6]
MNNILFKIVKSFLGIFVLSMGVYLIIASIQLNISQKKEVEDTIQKIKQEREEFLQTGIISSVGSSESDGENEYILRIPSIDSENVVTEGTSKEALKAALGHESDTVLPGELGNCVIAGHRNYTFGKFFNRLEEVEIGDMIYIDTPTDTYSYRVYEIKTVKPEDVEILENTDKEILTLYTCTPIYIATHRLVVIAERVF